MALPLPVSDPPSEWEEEELRGKLLPLVPAAAAVCGTDAPLFRLLTRAVFAPPSAGTERIKILRLADFAVAQAPAEIRERLDAWPHALCCPRDVRDGD